VKLGTTVSGKKTYYRIGASSEHSWAILSAYLLEFPLFGSKRLNFQDALECHKMVLEGRHLTEEGREKALALKNGMNNSRTVFNWDHLEQLKFY
jgi:aminopeptidase C